MKPSPIFAITTLCLLTLGALLLSGVQRAEACQFHWHHYGDGDIKNIIGNEIGAHIPDAFCKYSSKYEIVLETSAVVTRGVRAATGTGWGVATMRPIGSKIQQNDRYVHTMTDPDCTTVGCTNALAKDAALLSLDDMMSNLENYEFTK
ncbi:hypothetical protein [Paraburkholderia sp. RL17-347-BIC-D]|uniref:hypothetical protein n=1 Tax=Paraburkholderia sp. RL17-347-BIC-D TaxID=3031632 RepID=UPI0038BCB235